MIGTQAKDGNPYDGHTLKEAIKQATGLTGIKPGDAYCDKGYKGVPNTLNGTSIHLARKRKSSMKASEWAWYKRRSAIEPIIGHLKADHRMDRQSEEAAQAPLILAFKRTDIFQLGGRLYPLQFNTV